MLEFGPAKEDGGHLKTWHYPILNGSERSFQKRIIESCLRANTLVCLPTGLGKTFIGLVVMLNFHRWFPNRKIFFMAPTRPLVSQQYKSWNQTFGKNLNIKAVEITGSMGPEKRHNAWNENFIFFTTPQVLDNDLENNLLAKESVVCLVIDEAHKAVGNYAYCSIVNKLSLSRISFRVCALTASPGPNISSIQALIDHLNIAGIEYIGENYEEIKPFVMHRSKQVITVPPDPASQNVRMAIDSIISDFYISPLRAFGINLSTDIESLNVSNFNCPNQSGAVDGYIAGLRIMLHIRDLLVFYGFNAMASYLKSLETGQNSSLKSRIKKQIAGSQTLQEALADVNRMMATNSFTSHPKLKILSDILTVHFNQNSAGDESKAMVFSNFRDSVSEICQYLQKVSAKLRPTALLGHSSRENSPGTRKHCQNDAINDFLDGKYNIIVTTSVGEEGLDIGQVDLIIFYDAHSSPIRLIQRSGRTGRQREGKIFFLVNEKKEKSLLEASERNAQAMDKALANAQIHFNFSKNRNNPLNIDFSSLQMIKFGISTSSGQEKVSRKRKASFTPRNLPSVPEFDFENSVIESITSTGRISHSESTSAILGIFSGHPKKSTHKSNINQIWTLGIKNMPIFKPFGYEPIPLEVYQQCFDTILGSSTSSQIDQVDELPDEFFESQAPSIFKDLSDFENLSSDIISDGKNISTDFIDDNADLEAIDWSDSGF